MSAALKAAEAALGGNCDECVLRWGRFLAAAESSQWSRPSRFLQGLGEWAQDRPSTRRLGVGDKAVAATTEWLQGRRA